MNTGEQISKHSGDGGWDEVAAMAKTSAEFDAQINNEGGGDHKEDYAEDYEEEDYDESESELDKNYDTYFQIEPELKSGMLKLLEATNEHDIFNDDDYDNFLIDGDFLPQLVQCTETGMIALYARLDLESTLDEWAKQEGYECNEDENENSSSLTDQILAASIVLAAKQHAKGAISDEQFSLSKQAINNLGLTIPLDPENYFVRNTFTAMSSEQFEINQQLQQAGIIDKNFSKILHQQSLANLFQKIGTEVPDYLQDFPPEMQQYWNSISDEIHVDALGTYLKAISSTVYSSAFNNPDNPISPAIFFDEHGQPTPVAFSNNSPLFKDAFMSPQSYKANPDAAYALLEKFSDKLNPDDKIMLDALGHTITQKDGHMRQQLISFYYTKYLNHSESYLDESGTTVNDVFWERAGHEPDLAFITLFPGYEQHFSPSRIAAAELPFDARDNLRHYVHQFFGYEDETIETTLTPDGKLSQTFYKQNILGQLHAENLAASFPDQLAENFDDIAQSYLKLPSKYRELLIQHKQEISKNQPDFNYETMLSDYIRNGEPTDQLFQLAFDSGYFDLLTEQSLRKLEDLPLSENQFYALDCYKTILRDDHEHGIDIGKEYANAVALIDIDDLSHEQIDSIVNIVHRVTNSNAYELRHSGKNFLHDIVKSKHPERALDQVEQVFLHNNLPYAGKVFRTFQVLHPADTAFDDEFDHAAVIREGVLKDLPNTGPLSRESVLFADLMKTSIMSNNRQLKKYVKNLREGQLLTDQILDDSVDYQDLSDAERETLSTFVDHLETLYNQTQKGKSDPYERSDDIVHDLRELSDAFKPTERHNLSDRIVRSFTHLLGIRSLEDLENYINMSVEVADARGRERYTNQDFTLEENDLVKAVEFQYIDQILQNGSVCKEFLNGEAESDATPLDTDITRLGAECTGNISDSIDWKNRHAAFTPMAINLVIKNSNLIQTNGDKYDPSKLELVDNGDSNCGIRTGFPSSVIDFIVFDSGANSYTSNRDITENRNRLYSEIAKNGFYIPVVDKASGACIFTPEDYDQMRRKLSGLEQYDAPEFVFASDANLYTPGIESLTGAVLTQESENSRQRTAIESELSQILSRNITNFRGIKTDADGDLTPGFVELIDTGSTGRGTSIPGSKIDFDFIMRIDSATYLNRDRQHNFESILRQSLSPGEDHSTMNGLRLKEVPILGITDPVDLDISLVQRTNHMEFSTDQAIRERLQAIRAQDPDRYPAVVANIVLAKQFLKNSDVYKPYHSSDTTDHSKKGGLGGIGIENWILQNGGSFKAAAEDFLAAADRAGDNFENFCAIYPIWDAGQNHFTVRDNEESHYHPQAVYDNFVTRNMDSGGFQRMTVALRNYLSSISATESNTASETFETSP